MVMFSSLALLVMGGMLLMADSAEPELECKGTNDFDGKYTYVLSCTHNDESFTYEGTTSIHAAGNDLTMDSDADEISFKLLSTDDHDRSCEGRNDKKKYIQSIFYSLTIKDDARKIQADLECSTLNVMDRDHLIIEEQSGTCVPAQENALAPKCQIKLLPK